MSRWQHPLGDATGVRCPRRDCDGEVIYNGNYFCEHWTHRKPPGDGECDWALSHDDETGDPVGAVDRRVWAELTRRYEPLRDYVRKHDD